MRTLPPALVTCVGLAGTLALAGCGAGSGGAAATTSTTTVTAAPTTSGAGASTAASEPSATSSTAAAPQADPSTAATSAATTSTSPDDAPAGSCRALATSLTPEQRVGQLLMVGLDASWAADHNDATIARHHVGNVIYLGGWQGAERIRATSAHLQGLATPQTTGGVKMLLSADQEGGTVQQLRGAGFTRLTSAATQAAMPAEQLTAYARSFGRELAAAGVNMNLAPVADTVPASIGKANEPIGKWGRQYGSAPAVVGPAVAAVVRGLSSAQIATTVKHFPGLGRVTKNTDFSATGIEDSAATTEDPYLRPFADGIAAGASSVMVSSARYPKIDAANQAVFSRAVVTDLLRTKLGFRGVVVTDDMGNAAAVAATPPGSRAVRFVEAGGDLVITGQPTDVAPMAGALLERRAADPAFAAAIDASVTRVLALKARHGLASCR